MRLVILGPPGAGKGTQAELLSEALGIPHISTGDLFRANICQGTAVGVEAKKYLDAGNLVPSEITVDMVRARVGEPDAAKGFILDGFPRSTEQADALKEILASLDSSLDAVLSFEVDTDVVVDRSWRLFFHGSPLRNFIQLSPNRTFSKPKVDLLYDSL